MEEIRNFEEVTNQAMEVAEEATKSGKGIFGWVAGTAVVVGGAVVLYMHKTKDKREAKKIEKLRQKGYVIYKVDGEDFETEDDCSEEEK